MKRPAGLRAALAIFGCAGALLGCSRSDVSDQAKPSAQMTGQQLDAEMQRCRALGLKSYDDPSCKAALQENRDRFLGKSGGSR